MILPLGTRVSFICAESVSGVVAKLLADFSGKRVRHGVIMKKVEILLVEDSPSDIRLIREAIKESTLSIHITVAKDGVEAMEHLRSCLRGQSRQPDSDPAGPESASDEWARSSR